MNSHDKSQLLTLLRGRLGVNSNQALDHHINKIRAQAPCHRAIAILALASNHGIRIEKYASMEEMREVRDVLNRLSEQPAIPPELTRNRKAATGRSNGRPSPTIDPLLDARVVNQAQEMAAAYGLLYVLENSIRVFIDSVLSCKYRSDWLTLKCHLHKVVRSVKARMEDSDCNRWHQRRGARPIDYTDIDNLWTIVNSFRSDFIPTLLPDNTWFQSLIEEVARSRNVVAHMNPLTAQNVKMLQNRLKQWRRHIASKADSILSSKAPRRVPPTR